MKEQMSLKKFALKYGIYIGFLAIIIVFSILSSGFFTVRNFANILNQYAYYVICSMGMFFVVLVGGVDLSNGSMIAMAGVLGATVMVKTQNVLLGIIIVVGISVLGGIINGFSVVKFGMASFIATLAFRNVWRGVAYTYTSASAVSGIPRSLTILNITKILGIRSATFIMIIVFFVLFYILHFTSFGKKLYSIGGNPIASKIMGMKVDKITIIAYAICGLCTGIGTILMIVYTASANPTVAPNLALECIAAVIIGGASANGGEGSLIGAVVGAFMFAMIKNGLNLMGLSYFYQLIVSGTIIYITVAVDRLRVRAGY